MKHLLIAGVFVGLSLSGAHAAADLGTRLIYNVQIQDKGAKPPKITTQAEYIIGDKAIRFEYRLPAELMAKGTPKGMPMPSERTMVVIAHEKGNQYVLFPHEKTYLEVPVPPDGGPKSPESVAFTAAGKTRKVADISCDVMSRKLENREEEVCVAKGLRDVFDKMKRITTMGRRPGTMGALPAELPGLPVAYSMRPAKGTKGPQEANVTMSLKEMKKEKLADALFLPPSDYTRKIPVPDPASSLPPQ